MKVLNDVGYETPTPIQALTIPIVLSGRDVLGQAQTGTGKTAAFALPLLSRIDLKNLAPQVMVLTPTRELAIQVAEAFQRYATHMKGFHVLPVYGGQDIGGQLRQLRRGVHVVVGTPGRVMDHLRRGTLNLDSLSCLVLDEADEMLRMGFIDDVEWILEKTPPERQVALFSATLPVVIRRIAKKHLTDPVEVIIKMRTATADTINQRYWMVSGFHKLDSLTRILEAEDFDGMLIFVRTKTSTVELAEKLEARGFSCAPLNGDIPQNKRERTVDRFKSGKIDILVATDVAARGLDVDRISHVVNYDIPYDTEAYVHRIGRTGRAGRKGEAIMFVTPREKRMLFAIERATKQKIEMLEMPSTDSINDIRIARFKQRITDALATEELGFYLQMLEQYREEQNIPALDIAAALAKLLQGNDPLLLKPPVRRPPERTEMRQSRGNDSFGNGRPAFGGNSRPAFGGKGKPAFGGKGKPSLGGKGKPPSDPDKGMERFRIEVGHVHGVMPGNIVGAIANEAGLESRSIGRIDILDNHSTVDLPEGMPMPLLNTLKNIWVAGQQLNTSRLDKSGQPTADKKKPSFDAMKPKADKKKTPFDAMKPNPDKKKPSAPGKKVATDLSEFLPEKKKPSVAGMKPIAKRKPSVAGMNPTVDKKDFMPVKRKDAADKNKPSFDKKETKVKTKVKAKPKSKIKDMPKVKIKTKSKRTKA